MILYTYLNTITNKEVDNMKKFIKPRIFYISYFLINIINAYIFTSGLYHPNISPFTRDSSSVLFSFIGDFGILAIFFMFAWLIFPQTKKRVRFLTIITVIFSIFCVGLSSFANIFSLGFSFFQLESFQNPSQITFIMYYAKYVLSFITNAPQNFYVFPLIIFLLIRINTDVSVYEYFSIYQKLAALSLSLILVCVPFLSYNRNLKDGVFENTLNPLYASSQVGLYNYYFYDLYNYLSTKDQELTLEEKNEIIKFLDSKTKECYINPIDKKEYCRTNEYTAVADQMNLVLIQVEALNDFVIGLEVNGIEITPNLNKLVKESRYYNNFYSSAGIGNTSDSEFSALTSLYGNGNELTIIASEGSNYETLAKDFKKNNYITFSLHGNIGEFYNRKERHLATLGFDKHYEKKDFLDNIKGDLVHEWINDKDFLTQTVDILNDQSKPFFAYPITVVSHAPYVPSSEIPCNKYDFGKITNMSKNYLEHIMYFDEALGMFLDKMDEAGLMDNTVIALFGDHTSSLFKSDLESIFNTRFTDLNYRIEMQKVPFLIHAPSIIAPAVDNTVHSTVDLYPTFANLFGLEYKYKFGVDMLSDEPTLSYSPRTLDLFYDDFIILYPSRKLIDPHNKANKEELIEEFVYYKKMNDLILKKRYFR